MIMVGSLPAVVVETFKAGEASNGQKIDLRHHSGRPIVFNENSEVAIATTRGDLNHMMRIGNNRDRVSISSADIDNVPEILRNPEAILWDNRERSLLYLFNAENSQHGIGKLVVRILHLEVASESTRGTGDAIVIVNRLRTAGFVQQSHLFGEVKTGSYVLLKGRAY